MIVQMTNDHVDMVTDVHLRSFEGFFLSLLGPRFLRLYYESIVGYPEALGYVYVNDADLIGFVCGVVNPSYFYRYLLQTHWWRFAIAASSAILRRPWILLRLFKAFRYPDQTTSGEDAATLTSIAVNPTMQDQRIGAKLMQAFLEGARAKGVQCVDLTTDRVDNDKANTFYQKQGFHCRRAFTTSEGREMNEYVIYLLGE